jgi:8-oxo-dGTP pyrophosphatase MutT (NUDIX family)
MTLAPGLARQAGVIAWRAGQLCLVTSRGGRRWVVPKGNMEPYKSAAEVALQEAWEEAGLVGLIKHEPLGSYFYEKDGILCHVLVFLLDVTDQTDLYPEAAFRQRIWLPPQLARGRIEDPGLREIIDAVTIARAG